MATTSRSQAFVGRERELGEALEAIEEARRSGKVHFLLVHGEPGIGKSRLVEEVIARAGMLVVRGQCEEAAGAPAFQPFQQAFVQLLSEGRLRLPIQEIVGESPELVQMLPGLERTLDLPEAAPISPMNEQFRLFESSVRLLEAVGRQASGGLLVSIEDIHWADESSLALIRHFGRRLSDAPVVLLWSYRDEEVRERAALSMSIEALIRSGRAVRLPLKRWTISEVSSFLANAVRPSPLPAIVNAIRERTDGNPFFVTELVESLHAEGRLLDGDGAWRRMLDFVEGEVPGDALLVTVRMLRRAGETCKAALLVASILGRQFDFGLLQAVSELPQAELIAALDEATALGLIEPAQAGMRFSHELIRQALLHNVSTARREELHFKAATALRQIDLPEQSYSLAYHLHHAGTLADLEEVVAATRRAGELALAGFAPADAHRYLSMAIEQVDARGRSQQWILEGARLRALRGEALLHLSRYQDARPDFEAAARVLPPSERIDVLVPIALTCIWTDEMHGAQAAISEAAELCTELSREELRPAIEAVIAYCETNDGRLQEANERFQRAAELPGFSEPGAHTRLLAQFPMNLYWTASFEASIKRAEAGIESARAAHDSAELANLLPGLGMALAGAGRYREAAAAFAEAREVASSLGTESQALAALSKSVGYRVDTFDYDTALKLARQVYATGRSVGYYPYPAISSGIDLVVIVSRLGDTAEAEAVVESIASRVESEKGRHGWLWRARLTSARAELALAKGEPGPALKLADEALQQSRAILRPKYQALALESRGAALMAFGRGKEALESLREAVEVARPTGDPAMFLKAAYEYLRFEFDEELCAEAGAAIERIRENLPESMAQGFEESAPVSLIRRMRSDKPHEAPSRLPSGLSQRELEVLQLLIAGNSNVQIADALVLSVRTVERHINHIYAKLGVHSRTQATALVLREGLEVPQN